MSDGEMEHIIRKTSTRTICSLIEACYCSTKVDQSLRLWVPPSILADWDCGSQVHSAAKGLWGVAFSRGIVDIEGGSKDLAAAG